MTKFQSSFLPGLLWAIKRLRARGGFFAWFSGVSGPIREASGVRGGLGSSVGALGVLGSSRWVGPRSAGGDGGGTTLLLGVSGLAGFTVCGSFSGEGARIGGLSISMGFTGICEIATSRGATNGVNFRKFFRFRNVTLPEPSSQMTY